MAKPLWKGVHCIDRGDGSSYCQRPERHPQGQPLFANLDVARAAISTGPPYPCHKCLMAANLQANTPKVE